MKQDAIGMSALCQRPVFAGLAEPRLKPGGRVPPHGIRAAATFLLRSRQWLDGLIRRRRRGPFGNGGSEPQEEQPRETSIWDDPNLWMLMIH